VVRPVAGQPTWPAVDPNANDNVRSFLPPEFTESATTATRGPAGASFGMRPSWSIEARPPALRARCEGMVYQYESTGVNTQMALDDNRSL
jgi:hypothetical protein